MFSVFKQALASRTDEHKQIENGIAVNASDALNAPNRAALYQQANNANRLLNAQAHRIERLGLGFNESLVARDGRRGALSVAAYRRLATP